MQHIFNTGRGYTPQGQIIIVEPWKGPAPNTYIFLDQSRGVCDVVELPREPSNTHELQRLLMAEYDACNYVRHYEGRDYLAEMEWRTANTIIA